MEPVIIAQSRATWIVYLVAALAFVVTGVLLLVAGESRLIAWGAVVFFGGCALGFAWQIVDNRPRITISDEGIDDRMLKVGVIAWGDIRALWLYRQKGQPFVGLDLRDPEKYLARLSPLMKRMVALNEKLDLPALNLNLAGTRAVPELVEAMLQRELELRSPGDESPNAL